MKLTNDLAIAILEKFQRSFYPGEKKKAEEVLQDKEKAVTLLQEAKEKAQANQKGAFAQIWKKLSTAFGLLGDSLRGEYKKASRPTMLVIVVGLLYLVNPLDVIPDFIPSGFLDDSAVLAFLFKTISQEMDRYSSWKEHLSSVGPKDSSKILPEPLEPLK